MDGIREGRTRHDRLDERRQFDAPVPSPSVRSPAKAAQDTFAMPRAPAKRWSPGSAIRAVAADVALEWERGTGFLFVPLLLGIGAIIYFTAPAEPSGLSIALGFVAVAGAAYAARQIAVLHLALVAAALVICGMALAKLETWRASTPMLGAEISTRLTGRIVVVEEQPNGRTRLTIDVLSTERPTLRYAPERVRATARSIPQGLSAGDTVVGVVRLMPPSGPLRPGGYDFSFESYFDRIGAIGFFLRGPDRIESRPAGTAARFNDWVENTRAALAGRIEERIGGAEGEIAAALITGVRAGIPEDVNEALRRTGLAHVLSISGLHMALVAATVIAGMRFGFALFPGFSSLHAVRKYSAAIALVALSAYLFLSGAAVAAERSYLMIAVMLAALLVDRSALTMRNLALAAIVVLAMSPHEVMGPSFQMSFAATAALIGAYAWWSERRRLRASSKPPLRGLRRLPRMFLAYAGGLAATSIVAGLATTPYGAWHFHRVSPLSLAANLAAMPIVGTLVMPFAVGAMALLPFGLDGPMLDVMGAGIAAMVGVAVWFSERTPLDTVGAVPATAVACGTIALVFATLCTTRLRMLGVPFAVAGVLLVGDRDLPRILVSEDARLVGVRLDHAVAVSRDRPNAFTKDNWARAMSVDATITPSAALREEADGFSCGEGACTIVDGQGATLVWAETDTAANVFCGSADLIVVDDATATNNCESGSATMLTKRDLARKGSAEVTLQTKGNEVTSVTVHHAIGEPVRPWHAHRIHSRAARGLPPREGLSSGGSDRSAAPAP